MGRGGRGKEGSCPPGPVEPDQEPHIKSVDGFVFFRLSYFYCNNLQLFDIFKCEVVFSETNLVTCVENSVLIWSLQI